MKLLCTVEVVFALALLVLSQSFGDPDPHRTSDLPFLGFDRNDYPGDASLAALRKTFSFTGYWLNNPPGAHNNSWRGKRQAVEAAGFGFAVLFNGRRYAELKPLARATALGKSDAVAAAAAARQEGFPTGTTIFLDQEEGGRLLPEQRAYLHAWVDAINSSGFQAGVYCSGIGFREASGAFVITADDIREHAAGRKITYWVTNDACPPSPGCVFPEIPPLPTESGVSFASLWQFAQSPRRKDFARDCRNYNRDGNCYPPGVNPTQGLHVDVNTASSPDPSHGRSRR
jgi:glycoside hydrolase-like protein